MPYPPRLPSSEPDARVASPCVRNCCLDERDVCLGCGRSLDEIRVWGEAGDERRRQILVLAERRRAERMTRQGIWSDGRVDT